MAITKNTCYFTANNPISKSVDRKYLGIRGREANQLAELNLPVLPGIVIDATIAQKLANERCYTTLEPMLNKMGSVVDKKFGDADNPLLLKLVISPNLSFSAYPTLHNFGLTRKTVEGFTAKVGESFAVHEILFMLKGIFQIMLKTAELKEESTHIKTLETALSQVQKLLDNDKLKETSTSIMNKFQTYLPEDFFESSEVQLEESLHIISELIDTEEDNDDDVAILIQPMVYGNYGKDSYSGVFNSRDVVTGEKKLQGDFFAEEFDEQGSGKDVNTISPKYLQKLQDIAWKLEDINKDVRRIRFTIEAGKLWLIEQKSVEAKSTISLVHLLLDLYNRGIVDAEYVVTTVKPGQLNEILHPVTDLSSVKSLKKSMGGIAGAPGAAVGRVYFSANSLIDAQKIAKMNGEDTRCILCMPATYAGEVKAIEVSTGVLSNEGGYSAHASVVARQYGKISLVRPDMKIMKNKAIIDGITVNEGDIISLNVPYYGDPTIYFGEANLIEPDPKTSGLLDFIDLTKAFISDFHVRANADSPRDAKLAIDFGADGVGLCRTEHMFFKEERINIFREMILSGSVEEREKVLEKLYKFQKDDFYGIFKTMAGKEVTIRLLDAPLHEFLPHNDVEMAAYIDHMKKNKKIDVNKNELNAQIAMMSEINPMLGHRGCRVAISYPEIYSMQIRAIFDAAYSLQAESIEVHPEIMIPLVMSFREFKQIAFGKKIEGHSYSGLKAIEEEMREKKKAKKLDYKIGVMIELPSAALNADEIANYAQFFSFGTNDLTQTTLGLSRDDFNSFMPDYTMYDLVDGNPFAVLDSSVRQLIQIALQRGRLSRPELVCGLCGEHGARPENVKFCMEAGLNYVSCSSYSVPIALLAIAQEEIEKAKKEGRKLAPTLKKVRSASTSTKKTTTKKSSKK
ncbi:MAG: pyruvate, phosphate dikinase [Spirochaetaceae bacterium]|nr:pyruvate, phosphate dikinase [Spirochaetaceae bacterium]